MKFKNLIKRTLSLLLILALTLETVEAEAFDVKGPIMYNGIYYNALEEAVKDAQEEEYSTIYLYSDISVEEKINIKSSKKVKMIAEDSVTIKISKTDNFLSVEKDAVFVCENITFDGSECTNSYGTSPINIIGTMKMINSTITKFESQDSPVKLNSGKLEMDIDSYITENKNISSLGKGGGVVLLGKSYLSGGTVSSNSSKFSGGGIQANGEAHIENVTVNNNSTVMLGAGINVDNCELYINNCKIYENTISWNQKQMGYCGNDLFVDSSKDVAIYNVEIVAKNDTSKYYRMYLGGSGNKIVAGLKIIGEKDNNSDGLAIDEGKTVIKGPGTYNTECGEVKAGENSISKMGGKDSGAGLYVGEKANVEIEQLELLENTGSNGGAVYNKGVLILDNVHIENNTTTKKNSAGSVCGAGIYQEGELNLKKNANIVDQIYLAKDKYITVMENLLYHTSEYSAINVTVGEDNISENRAIVQYNTNDNETDAFAAVQNKIFNIEKSNNIVNAGESGVQKNRIVINTVSKNIVVHCVDEEKTPIAGLKLDIYKTYDTDNNVNIGTTTASDSNGKIVINGLNLGEYFFKQSNIVPGYEYDRNEKGKFIINENDNQKEIYVTIKKADLRPTAVITASKSVAAVNEKINFSAENSTDDKGTKSYYWNFGDGAKSNEMKLTHKYADEGTYTVSLTVTDTGNNISSTTYKVIIKGIPEKSRKTIVTVYDTDTEKEIKDAYVELWENDTTKTVEGKTNQDGIFNCYLNPGEYTAIIYRSGYYSRSTSVVVGSESQNVRVPLNTYNTVGGSLDVKELSLQEIKEAGIDISREENKTVTKYTLTLDVGIYKYYINGRGRNIKVQNDTKREIYQIDKNAFLVMPGSVSWVKQIFDVELVVINNSKVECIENSTATLNLPRGLSLADMKDENVNAKTVNIEKLNPGETATRHWYIRGDEDGIYNFDVSVSGEMTSEGIEPQKFHTVFSTTEPIYVYSKDVLFLNIRANKVFRNSSEYQIAFIYQNVSPRTLYNVEFNLDGTGYEIQGHSGNVISELKPGETVCIMYKKYISLRQRDPEDEVYLQLQKMGFEIAGDTIQYCITIYDNFYIGQTEQQYSYQKVSTSGDPVNMLTGAFEYNYTDLTLSGKNPLIFERYYNSKSDNAWTNNYSYKVSDKNNICEVIMPGGYTVEFYKEDGKYISQEGSELTLSSIEDGYLLKHRNGERYYFDKSGKLIRITGDKNREENIEYKDGKMSKVYSVSGTLYFEYDNNGNVIRADDGQGYSISLEYDNGKLISVTNADRDMARYSYDNNGYLAEVRDYNGVCTIKNSYDKYGRVIEQELADGGKFTFSYNQHERYNECKGQDNYFKAVYYNEKSQIIAEVSNSGSTSYEYNELNQMILCKDGEGKVTYYSYDENYNPVGILYPDGTTVTYTYDENNRIISETDENGNIKKYEYDNAGNVTSQTDAAGNISTYEYDKNGNCISKKDSLGYVTKLSYDERGNCIMATDAIGNKTYFSYDLQGKTKELKDAMGNVTEYNYTTAGKFVSEKDADGKIKEYGLDGNGFTTYEKDKAGNKTIYKYNRQSKLISSTTALNNKTSYQYDANGNLTVITDANGHSSTYTYDGDGNMVGITDALGNHHTYQYDKKGNIININDAKNNNTSLKYDDKNRKISETDNRGNITAYAYDNKGNIISQTDAQGNVIKYEYDCNGNKISETDENGNTTKYEYDGMNRLIAEEDAKGGKSVYTYDGVGNIIKITDAKGKTITYEYNRNCLVSKIKDKNGRIVTYDYDCMGQIISSNNDDGSRITYAYDANGNILRVKDEKGFCKLYTYDAENRKTSETDKNGNKTLYEYDKAGNLIKTTYADGGSEKRDYNSINLVTAITDVNGNTEKYEYDNLGNLTKITGAKGKVSEIVYDENSNITEVTDANGNKIHYTYDSLNRLIQIKDAKGNKQKYGYDAAGNTISYTDGNGNNTLYAYDELNRVTAEIRNDIVQKSYEYDSLGNVTKVITPDGAETNYRYDESGNVTAVTDALGNKTEFKYNNRKQIIRTTDASGYNTDYRYDSLGNVISKKDGNGNTTSYEYDANGNVIKEKTAAGTVTYTYDKMNRLTSEKDRKGNTQLYKYNKKGDIIQYTDKNGNMTRYEYDCDSNITKVTDAQNNVAVYKYDNEGNLIQTVLHRIKGKNDTNEVTSYKYDSGNMLIKETDSKGNVTSYTYDGNGNLKTKTDAKGKKTTYNYNSLNLVSDIKYADGKVVSYVYNKTGSLVRMTDDTGITSYELDLLSRIQSVKFSNGNTVKYSYDKTGNETSVTYPDSSKTSYTYDGNGNIKTVNDKSGVTRYTYTANNNVSEIASPDGVTEYRKYDSEGNITEISERAKSGSKKNIYTYSYDRQGNLIKESDKRQGKTATYEYDSLNQIIKSSEVKNKRRESRLYTYDSLGNLVREAAYNKQSGRSDIMLTSYSYNNLNRLLNKTEKSIIRQSKKSKKKRRSIKVTKNVTNTAYSYDKNGNLTDEKTSVNKKLKEQKSYTYNEYGKISGCTVQNGGVKEKAEYIYDGNAALVRKKEIKGSKKTVYNYTNNVNSINSSVLYEASVSQTKRSYRLPEKLKHKGRLIRTSVTGTSEKYVYGNELVGVIMKAKTKTAVSGTSKKGLGKLIGKIMKPSITGTESCYVHTDRLGSVTNINSRSGKSIAVSSYDVWGSSDISIKQVNSLFDGELERLGRHYTTYSYDDVSGKYYACDRIYDSSIKHFTTKDPVKGNIRNARTVNAYIHNAGKDKAMLGNMWRWTDKLYN